MEFLPQGFKGIGAATMVATLLLLFAGRTMPRTSQNEVSAQASTTEKGAATAAHNVLSRRYREGEKLVYDMKGINEDWRYQIRASGVVKKDSSGFFEEFGWSNLVSNNIAEALPAASLDFRQQISLDPGHNPSIPNLSQVSLKLIGPITDLMTFYADLWLAEHGSLAKPGDHFYLKHGGPNSWADGNYVLIGADSIDFDFTLVDVDPSGRTATLMVRHLPPQQPGLSFPAEWMRTPVADTPNNWMEVKKNPEGKFVAGAGKEIFDVKIKLNLADGKILSASLDNPVEISERVCADAALTNCGGPVRRNIRRQIELQLQQ